MSGSILYLSRADVERAALPMREVIDIVERAFREKGEGRLEMPPKPGIHTRQDSFIHAMPAYLSAMEAVGVKWVSGYPGNIRKGLPYVSGLMILNDAETGFPTAVMDCTWITAVRTGAATAVAAKFLARKESSSAGIVACGVQGRSNLEALACLFALRKVKAYDLRPEAARRFSQEMGRALGIEIEPVSRLEEAVKDLDLVVSSGPIVKEPAPAIEPGWLAPGAFACPLDFDSSWQGAALREADRIVTDDTAQWEYYRRDGYFRQTPAPDADLGEIAAGKKPGRRREDERIVSLNLGIAMEDVATAVVLFKRAKDLGIGRELPL